MKKAAVLGDKDTGQSIMEGGDVLEGTGINIDEESVALRLVADSSGVAQEAVQEDHCLNKAINACVPFRFGFCRCLADLFFLSEVTRTSPSVLVSVAQPPGLPRPDALQPCYLSTVFLIVLLAPLAASAIVCCLCVCFPPALLCLPANAWRHAP